MEQITLNDDSSRRNKKYAKQIPLNTKSQFTLFENCEWN